MQVANTNAAAGDTVYIKAGTYNSYIAPVNSGTSAANTITYRNYRNRYGNHIKCILRYFA